MKKVLLFTFLLQGFTTAIAQEVKNQSEIIKESFKPGNYKVIAEKYSGFDKFVNFEKIMPDKSKPKDNLELRVQLFPESPTDSKRESRERFFADKEIFPISYMSTSYEGNRKMQEQNGYVVRRGKYAGKTRLVFLKDYIFYLTYWTDKDNYTLAAILSNGGKGKDDVTKKKKKSGGFFKALKEGIKSGSTSTRGSNPKLEKLKNEVLQPYLDAATAIQNKMQSSPEALAAKKKAAAINKDMNSSIDSYNNVVYVNKTGRTIYIYRGNSTKGVMYNNGAKVKFPCTSGLNYDFTGKKWYYPNEAILLNTAGTTKKCGKTIEIK
ncbi:MAG: hypothetical protein ABJL44_17955 [Algibacter sp.]